jgi:predicted nucleotidyltransferase component of viral defense system
MSELTEFQRAVARAFFSLDAARDFVLTGGAALLAHDLTTRVTGDLDLFSTTAQHIDDAVAAFVAEAERNDWPVIIVRQSATFARIEVGETTGGHLVIDLGVDSAPILDTTVTDVGPTYQPQELAARKLLALFGRAEARDICDIYQLSSLFDLDELCELASRIDSGFSRLRLADALSSIDRFADSDFPDIGVAPDAIRAFADEWRRRLLGSGE